MDVEAIFLRTVRRYGLLHDGDRALVGVSGGSDSVTLLHLMVGLRQRRVFDVDLAVAHLDHAVRGAASRADAAFVAELARRQQVECIEERLQRQDDETPSEEQLRRERLAFYRRCAARWGATRVTLGHTRDDQAETLLLNLVRGAGARGLGAMRVSLPLAAAEGTTVIRPLLFLPRHALRDWLRARGRVWREDATNREPRFLRNRLRAELLPLLERLRPGVAAAIARAGHLLAEDDDLLTAMAQTAAGSAGLPLAQLRELPRPLARRLIRHAAREAAGGGPADRPAWAPGGRQVEAVLELIRARRGGEVDLGGGHVATVKGASLSFSRRRPS